MKVLIVEDSKVVLTYIKALLDRSEAISEVVTAKSGEEGVEKALNAHPDLILMDLNLPGMHGLDAIEEIMMKRPVPIVVLSGDLNKRDIDLTFEALRTGAVKVIAKPEGIGTAELQRFEKQLISTLRIMSKVKVVRRKFRRSDAPQTLSTEKPPAPKTTPGSGSVGLLVIGCSTGGPATLFDIFSSVKNKLRIPVLIAQHIMPDFEQGLCDWLRTTGHPFFVPKDGQKLRPGQVHVATAGTHLYLEDPVTLRHRSADGDLVSPSSNVLFQSAAHFYGAKTCGMVLTGMGNDGADGMVAVSRAGGITVAQQPESCVIDSMPSSAIRTGHVQEILPPAGVASFIDQLNSKKAGAG